MKTILVLNPGSTSTKVALFHDAAEAASKSIEHPLSTLKAYESVYDQLSMRLAAVQDFLAEAGVSPAALDAIVARGGMLPPVQSGAYVVDEALVDALRNHPAQIHASNLGGLMAYELTKWRALPALIYDSVSVDELTPIARISGVKDFDRKSFSHALNTRAVGMRYAHEHRLNYEELRLIVVHLGGGISMNLQIGGKLVDVVTAEEGPFSTGRAGGMQTFDVIEICRKQGFQAMTDYETRTGGLVSYLGTEDAREVERRIDAGDAYAAQIYEAMAYKLAKSIGGLATAAMGKVDAILLTGGLAKSARLTGWIRERVEFLAPVFLYPGEFEMQALAEGALRVLNGGETARRFE